MNEQQFLEKLEAYIDKVDGPERLAQFKTMGQEKYTDATFLNLLKNGLIKVLEKLVPRGGNDILVSVQKVDLINEITFPATAGFYEVQRDLNGFNDSGVQLYYARGGEATAGNLQVIINVELNEMM